MTVETTYPGASNAFRTEWPMVGSGSGIFGAYNTTPFSVQTSGAEPVAIVSPGNQGPAVYKVAGFAVVLPASKTLRVDNVGVQPAAGQKRCDLIVARYDWSQPASTAGTIAIRPGSPVATSALFLDSLPELVQERGVLWEEPIWAVERLAGAVISGNQDMRTWWGGDVAQVALDAELVGPIGCFRYQGAGSAEGGLWTHYAYEDGSTGWVLLGEDARVLDRDLARPRIERIVPVPAGTLQIGPITQAGVVLGGATRRFTRPVGASRALVELFAEGFGPPTGDVNGTIRLTVGGSAGQDTRIWAGQRGGYAVHEVLLPARQVVDGVVVNGDLEVQTFAKAVSALDWYVGAETSLTYKVTFS